MRKKIILALAAVLLIAAIAVTAIALLRKAADERLWHTEYDYHPLGFDQVIEYSNCAVIAEYVSSRDGSHSREYVFKVKEVLYGEFPEETIHMAAVRGGTYRAGKDYVLPLHRNDYIWHDYPLSSLTGDIFIPAGNLKKSTLNGQPIAGISDASDIEAAKAFLIAEKGPVTPEKKTYTTATDMPTTIDEAEFVLEVQVLGLEAEGIYRASPYNCKVVRILKGGVIETYEDSIILLTMLKGSVKTGQTYVVAAHRLGEYSLIYSQFAEKGIYPVTDKQAMREIAALLPADGFAYPLEADFSETGTEES